MSAYTEPSDPRRRGAADYEDWEEIRSNGWCVFAGVLLLVVGTLNIIEGIGAIGNAHFFVHSTSYIFGSLNLWGWVVLIVGVAELAAGLGVLIRNQFARWAGVAILCLSAVVQLLMMPSYPFWALSLFAADIVAVYGLIVHGKRLEA